MQKQFYIRYKGKYIRIFFKDILYVEGLRNYLKIHCRDKSYLILMSLKRMTEILPEDTFHRIHKSYIISLEHLSEFNNETAWLGNITLPIGSHFGKELLDKVKIAGEHQEDDLMEKPIVRLGNLETARLGMLPNGH
jgi:DNA-binding LytR/AlgR family response regulator